MRERKLYQLKVIIPDPDHNWLKVYAHSEEEAIEKFGDELIANYIRGAKFIAEEMSDC